MELSEIHLIPKHLVAIVVVRSNEVPFERMREIAYTVGHKNPSAVVLYAGHEMTIETLDYQQTMNVVTALTDRMTTSELASMSLKRIIV
jgi:hypothetical protein